MPGVGVGEEQLQLALLQLAVQRLQVGPDLACQLLVLPGQLAQLDQVMGAALQGLQRIDLVAELGALTGQRTGACRIVPGALGAQQAL